MADDEVDTRQEAPEFATVQQVRDMIEEASMVQRLWMDQRLKEMSDQLQGHLTVQIKPLEDMIRAGQIGSLAGNTRVETGGSSQVRNQGRDLAFTVTESLANKKPKMTNVSQQIFPQPSLRSRPRRACFRCGTCHRGRCHATEPLCYKCGDSGHLSFDCPLGENFCCAQCGEMGHVGVKCLAWQSRSRSRGPTARPTVTFVPTAPGSNMGMFTVNANFVLVLPDSRVTQCFVSHVLLEFKCESI